MRKNSMEFFTLHHKLAKPFFPPQKDLSARLRPADGDGKYEYLTLMTKILDDNEADDAMMISTTASRNFEPDK